MKFHRHYERLLARADELTEGEREELLAHLGTCLRCRREQRAQRAQDEVLRQFAGAQPPVSLDAAVLARIRHPSLPLAEPVPHPRVRVLPAATGLVLAASLVIAAGLTLGGRLLPRPASPAVTVRGHCTVAGASWELKGPCRIVSSPEALRSPSVVYYPLALRWAQQHLHDPHYIVRRNDRLPVLVRHAKSGIYFSEVAADQQSHQSVYVVGEQQ
jgi:anti-sigma factor RsiW